MDLSMLSPNNPQGIIELIRNLFNEINTAIPGEIVAFNFLDQTATIKPCIRTVTIDQKGIRTDLDLPEIMRCPVWFPYSTISGFSLTYPIAPKDQCLIIFSQRSFDNWLEFGSIQSVQEFNIPRTHSYNDAIALVGLIPKVNAITDFQNDGIEIRNKTRTSFVKVSNTKIEQTAPQIVNKGITQLEGNIKTSVAPGSNIETGLTVNVGIPGATLVFVNGLLVRIDAA